MDNYDIKTHSFSGFVFIINKKIVEKNEFVVYKITIKNNKQNVDPPFLKNIFILVLENMIYFYYNLSRKHDLFLL